MNINTKTNFSENIREFLNQKNPVYFFENYIKIFNQQFGIVPFKLFDFQKDIVNLWLKQNNIIILKSRQTGITTLLQQLQLWLQLFYENYYIGIVSLEESRSIEFLRGIKYLYYSMVQQSKNFQKIKHFLPTPVKEIEKTFQFSNRSRILQGNTNNPFRGYPLSTIICDEQQFVQNLKEQLDAVAPTLQTIQKQGIPHGIILNSTPNGINNYFYHLYKNQMPYEFFQNLVNLYGLEQQKREQKEKYNGYVQIRVHWTSVPYYDQEWYLEQKQLLGNDERQIQQELELSFTQQNDTLISQETLDEIGKNLMANKEFDIINFNTQNRTYYIKRFEPPKQNKEYFIGVDTSFGQQKDDSQVVVVDSNQKVVASFQDSKINDKELQTLIYYLQTYYSNQWVGIEKSQLGFPVQRILFEEFEYKNIFSETSNSKSQNKKQKSVLDFGVQMNQVTRPIILKIMKETIEADPSIITDEEIFKQLQTFIGVQQTRFGIKFQQSKNSKDDYVMQLQIQLYIRHQLLTTQHPQQKQKIDIQTLANLKLRETQTQSFLNQIENSEVEKQNISNLPGPKNQTQNTTQDTKKQDVNPLDIIRQNFKLRH